MRLALDISSLSSGHKFRGLGFYTKRLLAELKLNKKITLLPFTKKPPKNIDLIHYPAFTLFHPQHLLFRNRTPVVITVHDLIPLKYPQHFPPGIKGSLKWQLQKQLLKQAQAIITDSQASQTDIIKFTGIPKSKIKVIYLAADQIFKPLKDKVWLAKIKKRYQLPPKFILYVGDMNWNKNILALVKSCLKLKYPLVVVGKQVLSDIKKPHHPEVKELVLFQQLATTHPETIIRLGFAPTKDLVGIYNLAACYAQPSRAEGFGLPVLEAMACGCPVVTSKATSLSEIAGQAAQLIDPHSQTQLTAALKAYWQSPSLRTKMSRLGLNQVKQFSWQKTATATFKVYEKISQ